MDSVSMLANILKECVAAKIFLGEEDDAWRLRHEAFYGIAKHLIDTCIEIGKFDFEYSTKSSPPWMRALEIVGPETGGKLKTNKTKQKIFKAIFWFAVYSCIEVVMEVERLKS